MAACRCKYSFLEVIIGKLLMKYIFVIVLLFTWHTAPVKSLVCSKRNMPSQWNMSSQVVHSVNWRLDLVCSTVSECDREETGHEGGDIPIPVQLCPLEIQVRDRVLLIPPADNSDMIKIGLRMSHEEWIDCPVYNNYSSDLTLILNETTPVEIPSTFLQPGILLIAQLRNGLFSNCQYGLRLSINVKDHNCTKENEDKSQHNLCSNNGACVRDLNSTNYHCACNSTHYGVYCEELNACHEEPCGVGGVCVDSLEGTEFSNFTCKCKPNFQGKNCDQLLPSENGCESYPCPFNATCIDQSDGSFQCICPMGTTGAICNNTIDNVCMSNPCKNGADCQPDGDTVRCNCSLGFNGVFCENLIQKCSDVPNICVNGGHCMDTPGGGPITCQCPPGWTGDTCGELDNTCRLDPCVENSTCVDTSSVSSPGAYLCLCPEGFSGIQCQIDIDECASTPCKNNGLCTDNIGNFTCQCLEGYNGTTCENNINACDKYPCQNNSTCKDSDIGLQYTCQCRQGFTGENCESNINECASDPCQNSAACHDIINGYICNCSNNFFGIHCTYDTDYCQGEICNNGATCITLEGDYQCQCVEGYTGKNCSENINDCLNHTCSQNSTCMDEINGYNCLCNQGFTGEGCESLIDFCIGNDCNNNSTCISNQVNYTCQCLPGFEGSLCEDEIDECLGLPCKNGAVCQDLINGFQCFCTNGFQGEDCSIPINDCLPNPCHPNNTRQCIDGTVNYTCMCKDGYQGRLCEQEIDECEQNLCVNNSTCEDMIADFRCLCPSGLTGRYCEVNINECNSSLCGNGTCKDLVDSFFCECPKDGLNYDKFCQPISLCESNPCNNSVKCMDYMWENRFECICLPGYSGDTCSQEINECEINNTVCQNNGTCLDLFNNFTCQCLSGFEGRFCEINIDDCQGNKCGENATCIDSINGYLCRCKPGFFGTFCEELIASCIQEPCYNGAICLENNSTESDFQCKCPPGYSGLYCENDIDECQSFPCQQDAFCVNGNNSYTCECPPGFTGVICETDINECMDHNCTNGGACVDGIDTYTCECTKKYTGQFCQSEVDECTSNPCQNDGLCVDRLDGYVCFCRNGFTGLNCEENYDECLSNPCQNGGECVDDIAAFKCQCKSGYTGFLCEGDVNECVSNPCLHGQCFNEVDGYTCECFLGFNGTNCDIDIDECESNPCLNNGVCRDHVNSYICDCINPFRGIHCESLPCDLNPCAFNGECINDLENLPDGFRCNCIAGVTGKRCQQNINDCNRPDGLMACSGRGLCLDGLDTYICLCPPGWKGPDCEYPVNDCEDNECQNNSTCANQRVGYRCICPPGYEGTFCEREINECGTSPCGNEAQCIDLFNDFRCICKPGWTGKACLEEVNECDTTVDNPCLNNSTCVDMLNNFTCQCQPSFTGRYCETEYDPCDLYYDPCLNGGNCTTSEDGSYNCTCEPGFEGTDCEVNINECQSAPCQNEAECKDGVNEYTCQCLLGFTGVNCETNIDDCFPNPCFNDAICEDAVNGFICNCSVGFVGLNCTDDVDECGSDPCKNKGICIDEISGYSCICMPGYTGVNCETETDECSSFPCENEALCQDNFNGFTCFCPLGFTGPTCNINVDDCRPNPCGEGNCTDLVNDYECDCPPWTTGLNCETYVTTNNDTIATSSSIESDSLKNPSTWVAPGITSFPSQELLPTKTAESSSFELTTGIPDVKESEPSQVESRSVGVDISLMTTDLEMTTVADSMAPSNMHTESLSAMESLVLPTVTAEIEKATPVVSVQPSVGYITETLLPSIDIIDSPILLPSEPILEESSNQMIDSATPVVSLQPSVGYATETLLLSVDNIDSTILLPSEPILEESSNRVIDSATSVVSVQPSVGYATETLLLSVDNIGTPILLPSEPILEESSNQMIDSATSVVSAQPSVGYATETLLSSVDNIGTPILFPSEPILEESSIQMIDSATSVVSVQPSVGYATETLLLSVDNIGTPILIPSEPILEESSYQMIDSATPLLPTHVVMETNTMMSQIDHESTLAQDSSLGPVLDTSTADISKQIDLASELQDSETFVFNTALSMSVQPSTIGTQIISDSKVSTGQIIDKDGGQTVIVTAISAIFDMPILSPSPSIEQPVETLQVTEKGDEIPSPSTILDKSLLLATYSISQPDDFSSAIASSASILLVLGSEILSLGSATVPALESTGVLRPSTDMATSNEEFSQVITKSAGEDVANVTQNFQITLTETIATTNRMIDESSAENVISSAEYPMSSQQTNLNTNLPMIIPSASVEGVTTSVESIDLSPSDILSTQDFNNNFNDTILEGTESFIFEATPISESLDIIVTKSSLQGVITSLPLPVLSSRTEESMMSLPVLSEPSLFPSVTIENIMTASELQPSDTFLTIPSLSSKIVMTQELKADDIQNTVSQTMNIENSDSIPLFLESTSTEKMLSSEEFENLQGSSTPVSLVLSSEYLIATQSVNQTVDGGATVEIKSSDIFVIVNQTAPVESIVEINQTKIGGSTIEISPSNVSPALNETTLSMKVIDTEYPTNESVFDTNYRSTETLMASIAVNTKQPMASTTQIYNDTVLTGSMLGASDESTLFESVPTAMITPSLPDGASTNGSSVFLSVSAAFNDSGIEAMESTTTGIEIVPSEIEIPGMNTTATLNDTGNEIVESRTSGSEIAPSETMFSFVDVTSAFNDTNGGVVESSTQQQEVDPSFNLNGTLNIAENSNLGPSATIFPSGIATSLSSDSNVEEVVASTPGFQLTPSLNIIPSESSTAIVNGSNENTESTPGLEFMSSQTLPPLMNVTDIFNGSMRVMESSQVSEIMPSLTYLETEITTEVMNGSEVLTMSSLAAEIEPSVTFLPTENVTQMVNGSVELMMSTLAAEIVPSVSFLPTENVTQMVNDSVELMMSTLAAEIVPSVSFLPTENVTQMVDDSVELMMSTLAAEIDPSVPFLPLENATQMVNGSVELMMSTLAAEIEPSVSFLPTENVTQMVNGSDELMMSTMSAEIEPSVPFLPRENVTQMVNGSDELMMSTMSAEIEPSVPFLPHENVTQMVNGSVELMVSTLAAEIEPSVSFLPTVNATQMVNGSVELMMSTLASEIEPSVPFLPTESSTVSLNDTLGIVENSATSEVEPSMLLTPTSAMPDMTNLPAVNATVILTSPSSHVFDSTPLPPASNESAIPTESLLSGSQLEPSVTILPPDLPLNASTAFVMPSFSVAPNINESISITENSTAETVLGSSALPVSQNFSEMMASSVDSNVSFPVISETIVYNQSLDESSSSSMESYPVQNQSIQITETLYESELSMNFTEIAASVVDTDIYFPDISQTVTTNQSDYITPASELVFNASEIMPSATVFPSFDISESPVGTIGVGLASSLAMTGPGFVNLTDSTGLQLTESIPVLNQTSSLEDLESSLVINPGTGISETTAPFLSLGITASGSLLANSLQISDSMYYASIEPSSTIQVLPSSSPITTVMPPLDCASATCPDHYVCHNFTTEDKELYQCVCDHKHEGVLCQNVIDHANMHFNGSGYIQFPNPDLQETNDITLFIQTKQTDGLVFYSARYYDTRDSPYIKLYIQQGFLMYEFSCVQRRYNINSDTKVNTGEEIKIIIIQSKYCKADLTIVTPSNSTNIQLGGDFLFLDLSDLQNFYLGGIPTNLTLQPQGFFTDNFIGCVKNFTFDDKLMDIELSTYMVNVEDCNENGLPTPIPPPPLPSCDDVVCQNGGICQDIVQADGRPSFQCDCQLHFDGPKCEREITVFFPSFTGKSYIVHKDLNFTKSSNEIAVTFKTSVNAGTIFYSQSKDEQFVHLYVENGELIYQLTCGQSSTLVIDSQTSVVHGNLTTVKIIQTMGTAQKECGVTMTIDDGGTIESSLTSASPIQHQPLGSLYLGGVPLDLTLASKTNTIENFEGCIRHLELDNEEVLVFKDAINGANIIECDVPMCSYQPCLNNGTCHIDGESWYCECINGFIGSLCERTPCDHNPCTHGATCLHLEETATYACLCPYGRHGRNCSQAMPISRPGFFGLQYGYASFMAHLPVPKLNFEFIIRFKFKLAEVSNVIDSSLMLYAGQEETTEYGADFLTIGIEDGYLVFRYELGSGVASVKSLEPLDLNIDIHTVRVGRKQQDGWLIVDNQQNSTGKSPGTFKGLNVYSPFFVGGHDSYDMTLLPSGAQFQNSFQGCIFDLEIKTGSVGEWSELGRVLYGRNVQECDVTECDANTCANGGICVDLGASFRCECKDDWKGPLCNDKVTPCDGFHNCSSGSICSPVGGDDYECLCPLGRTGNLCDNNVSISDALFVGERSYMAFYPPRNIRLEIDIEMQFKTNNTDGLLVYIAEHLHERSGDFLGLSLYDGVIMLHYNTGEPSQTSLGTRTKFDRTGSWNYLSAGRNTSHVYIDLNGERTIQKVSHTMIALDVSSLLYIGGLPDLAEINPTAVHHEPIAYEGCIRSLKVNGIAYELNEKGAVEGLSIEDCDGTVCGYDVCKNNGSCSTYDSYGNDSTNENFICQCTEDYFGDFCEISVFCQDHQCSNGAKCLPNIEAQNYTCACAIGWKGPYCGQEEEISYAAYFDNSFVKFEDKKYSGENETETYISFNMSSIALNGMILWNGQVYTDKDDYFGVGIMNGRLKVVINLGWWTRHEMISDEYVSDGNWHQVTILRIAHKLEMSIDDHMYAGNIEGEFNNLDTLGIYNFGGFAAEDPIVMATAGNFYEPFTGCLKDVSIKQFEEINFQQAVDGSNLLACDLEES